MTTDRIDSVLIVGGGSAGLLAGITLRAKFPDLQIEVVRSTAMGHIMVGEGTVGGTPWQLHNYIGIPVSRFFREVRPTWKKGIRFTWGPRPFFDYCFTPQFAHRFSKLSHDNGFYCTDHRLEYVNQDSALMSEGKVFLRRRDGLPAVDGNTAYHLENGRLVAFLETYATELGVLLTDDKLVDVKTGANGIDTLRFESGRDASADLYIDCTGFRSELLGKALGVPFVGYDNALFCDRALAGGWERTDEPIEAYTRADTMNSGWAWQIEHEEVINRGYVFSSSFISEDEARAEFQKLCPQIPEPRLIRFPTGRRQSVWVKNVVGVGNASGFVEPLEATSLQIILKVTEMLSECLNTSNRCPTPTIKSSYNEFVARKWDCIRDFLALHYKLNKRIDTPFWKACINDTDLGDIQEFVDFYQENGPVVFMSDVHLDRLTPFGAEGYLAMLVGMATPYKTDFVADQQEREIWSQLLRYFHSNAAAGMTVAEALEFVHSDRWIWGDQDNRIKFARM